MTTVIKAVGSVFTNTGLGNIGPFIRDGLIGAYRFDQSNYLQDLSGNGNNLTAIGSPVVRDGYAVGNGAVGFNTPILETLNMTLIVVYRRKAGDTNFGFGAGNYSNGPHKGLSTFIEGISGVVNTQVCTKLGGESVNSIVTLDTIPVAESNFTFHALSLDATNSIVISGRPLDKLSSLTFTPTSLSNRILGGSNHPFKIIATLDSRPMWTAEMHVAEVLIYNRALSFAEITEQYKKSKKHLSKAGINI